MKHYCSPIVENESLLISHLENHPEFQMAGVCSCGKVMPSSSIGGHIGGSNKKWTRKAKTRKGKRFELPHKLKGYTLMER